MKNADEVHKNKISRRQKRSFFMWVSIFHRTTFKSFETVPLNWLNFYMPGLNMVHVMSCFLDSNHTTGTLKCLSQGHHMVAVGI